jgi:hypothetical protein
MAEVMHSRREEEEDEEEQEEKKEDKDLEEDVSNGIVFVLCEQSFELGIVKLQSEARITKLPRHKQTYGGCVAGRR